MVIIGSIMKLPDDWATQNCEMASFRYTHPNGGVGEPSQAREEFYVKMLYMGGKTLELNALSSLKNDEIHNCEIE
jgi:hypothetical protein